MFGLCCYALISVLSSFTITLTGCFALIVFLSVFCGSSSRCRGLIGLQCVIVVFPDHTHLPFGSNPCRFKKINYILFLRIHVGSLIDTTRLFLFLNIH